VIAFCIFIKVYYIAEKEAVFLYNKGCVNHEMANKFNELHGKRIIFNSIFRFSFTVVPDRPLVRDPIRTLLEYSYELGA
jgi:hypothetical protein